MAIDSDKVKELAAAYGERDNCDVLLFTGPLDLSAYRRLSHGSGCRNRRRSVLVILITWGGDAHVAYKMGRCLQRRYQEVRIFVAGSCKSAGTLLAISGHQLIVDDDGELGPIDVQQMRQDELWERASGLIESTAMESLGQVSWDLFERLVTEIKDMSFGRITFKTAAEAAAPIVSGMLSPIFAQIDPLKVGETARALQIASKYAELLDKTSQNLRRELLAIDKLATGYPDHGFIIDREEAETLFRNVSGPDDLLQSLSDSLGSLDPNRAVTIFLNDELPAQTSSKETNSGAANKGNGVEQTDEHTPPADGNLANAEKDQAADREDGTASDQR